MAAEPKRIQDQEKFMSILEKLSDEDPTFRYKIDEETGQTIISGMGELHLDVKMGRVQRDFSVEINKGKPQVVYRETVTKTIDYEEIFDRELGGQHHYAGVKIRVAPTLRGKGNSFVNECGNTGLIEDFVTAIREGVEEAMGSGVLLGYPVIDTEVTLIDVSIKESETDAMAFKIVSGMAFQNACRKSDPVLLEPIMKAEILVPDEFMGEVISDLSSRQGRIEHIESKSTVQIITASVPLSKMFGYSTSLRSVSQGRGNFSMQFRYYDNIG